MARPSKWETDVKDKLILVQGWAREGLIDEQIAKNLGIGFSTFNRYKEQYQELREALKKGKEVVDFEVENALYKKALSGDTTAMIFWLKNRKPKTWRDKQEVDMQSTVHTITVEPPVFGEED